MPRRHLVIVRAGDQSLHEAWLPPEGEPRSWDLVVSYFGEDPNRYRRADVRRIDAKGPKWLGLHTLLTSGEVDWQSYNRIWLPDDDLAADPLAVERLLERAEAYALELAQPSLTADSYISHPITVHNPAFEVRLTNFVEVMAPVLSRQLLERVLPTFTENQSGWGLDYLWQMFVDRPRRDCGIIDAVQVRHTRPVGGPNYEALRQTSRSPHTELQTLRRKYRLTDASQVCWGALTTGGEVLALGDDHSASLLLGLVMQTVEPRLASPEAVRAALLAHIRHSPHLTRLANTPTEAAGRPDPRASAEPAAA